MNFQTKYRENVHLLEGYVGFLNECTTYEEKVKLSAEIARLVSQNKQIDAMPYSYTKTDISDYTIEVKAILRDPNPIDPHFKIPQLITALKGNPTKEHLLQALAYERKNKKRSTAVHLLKLALRNKENENRT